MQTIHQYAQTGEVDKMVELLQRGVNVDTLAQDKSTALHFAVFAEKSESVRFLLQHGASINMKNQRGLTPLHIAANSGNEIITVLLLENGADPNAKDNAVCIYFSKINRKLIYKKKKMIN